MKKNGSIEFETLHSNKHRIHFLTLFVCVVVLLVVFIVGRSHAKYRITQSIPLVTGTINYTPYDFKTVAMYQKEEGGDYVSIDQVPTGGYTLNTEQSYCEVNDEKDSSIPMSYEGGRVYIGVTSKGTKCYLYFDEKRVTNAQELIASKNVATRTDFSTTLTDDTTGTIYYADTSKGRTYYFAGAPTDNWVRFGGFYWRIIRINEDGTIRMIYQGTSASGSGQIQTSAFNSSYDNNAYVGYMYQSNQVHGLTSSSTIKGILDTWYQNNLQSHADKIDGNAGFCGDRTPSTSSTTSNGSGGTGTMQTYYGAYIRLVNSSKNPTFDCENDSDLYTINGSNQGNKALTYPIGLITADEVAYAGGVWNTINQSYYLYTNSIYWTMSPHYFFSAGHAYVFYVGSTGNLSSYGNASGSYGARPVINLKADVTISGGTGQATDPYIVN